MEGIRGIEPRSLVWKTKALPLSYIPVWPVTGIRCRPPKNTVPDCEATRRYLVASGGGQVYSGRNSSWSIET